MLYKKEKKNDAMVKLMRVGFGKKRLGHICFNHIFKLGRKYVVRDMPKNSKPENTICK
jgi:hypothetical protein